MNRLKSKNVVVGVTGGIAAYKSAELVRRLLDEGCEVRVVMTAGAEAFVSPMTFQALSGNPVHQHLLDPEAEAGMGHIELARWAGQILVAPATANFIARLAQGVGDDLLSTICLATEAPIAIAPAMNRVMWQSQAVQENIRTLASRSISLLGPDSGDQACGEVGAGRMRDPLELIDNLVALQPEEILSGKRVVITAGPTRERIDPVRYLSNDSSGKMGYALAEACAAVGAAVRLISGPVCLQAPAGVELVEVESAKQMQIEVLKEIEECDLFIAAAAVADFTPESVAFAKIKKSDEPELSLRLVKTPDILASVAKLTNRPFVVGFAAETENLIENSKKKLKSKGADMIVANDVSRTDTGFSSDYNEVVLLTSDSEQRFEKTQKRKLASELVEQISRQIP